MYLFTDASAKTEAKKSIGCYLILDTLDDINIKPQIEHIILNTEKSTNAEFLTIKHVLGIVDNKQKGNNMETITLYTDCENFCNLIHKRQYKPNLIKHRNYEFYKEMIDIVNKYKINCIWVKGHDKDENKLTPYEKIFKHVDHKARELSRDL